MGNQQKEKLLFLRQTAFGVGYWVEFTTTRKPLKNRQGNSSHVPLSLFFVTKPN
jgi:hypothetical protein